MPDRWLTDPHMDILSDRAWRTFAGSLMWSNGAGTDGRIPATALRFLHPLGVDLATADELITAGKWESLGEGAYQVAEWNLTQSTAAELERLREYNRVRQARHRDKLRADVTGYVTRDVTRDVTSDVTHLSPGKARQGKAQLVVELNNAGTSDPAEPETTPDQTASAGDCEKCQRGAVFGSGPCPDHRPAA